MDEVTYLKEKVRMTDNCRIACKDCPLYPWNSGESLGCLGIQNHYPEKAVAIVEKWSKENPVMTIRDKFLEVFPDAPLHNDGIPEDICPNGIGYKDLKECGEAKCQECWSQPYVKKS